MESANLLVQAADSQAGAADNLEQAFYLFYLALTQMFDFSSLEAGGSTAASWFDVKSNPIYKFVNHEMGLFMVHYMGYAAPPRNAVVILFLAVIAIAVWSFPFFMMVGFIAYLGV